MSRLTETDSQGNWALSGVAWMPLPEPYRRNGGKRL